MDLYSLLHLCSCLHPTPCTQPLAPRELASSHLHHAYEPSKQSSLTTLMCLLPSTVSRLGHLVGKAAQTSSHLHFAACCRLQNSCALGSTVNRGMSTSVRFSLSHEERTAQEHRESAIHHVILNRIEQVSDTMRLLQLVPPDRRPIKVCLHVPELTFQTVSFLQANNGLIQCSFCQVNG